MSTLLNKVVMLVARLIRALLISLVIVLSTTYGWRPFLPKPQINSAIQLSSARLEQAVRYLSEDIGVRNYAHYENLENSALYIEQSFKDLGYSVQDWQYNVGGRKFKNIVAELKNNDSHEYILVGAHYDSCFTPGADDNASGVAGVLELARYFKETPVKGNILFVAFTNEEPPFFRTAEMGSRVFIKHLSEKKIKVSEAIILEMIGVYSDKWFSQKYLPLLGPFYPNKGSFVALVGNFDSSRLVDFIRNDFKEHKFFPMESIIAPGSIPGINFSDHASFWEAGIPAVMITDTAYLRNINYHQPTDTIDKIDFSKMAAVIERLKGTIVRLVNQ